MAGAIVLGPCGVDSNRKFPFVAASIGVAAEYTSSESAAASCSVVTNLNLGFPGILRMRRVSRIVTASLSVGC